MKIEVNISDTIAAALVDAFGLTAQEHVQAAVNRVASAWENETQQLLLAKYDYLDTDKKAQVKALLKAAKVPLSDTAGAMPQRDGE